MPVLTDAQYAAIRALAETRRVETAARYQLVRADVLAVADRMEVETPAAIGCVWW